MKINFQMLKGVFCGPRFLGGFVSCLRFILFAKCCQFVKHLVWNNLVEVFRWLSWAGALFLESGLCRCRGDVLLQVTSDFVHHSVPLRCLLRCFQTGFYVRMISGISSLNIALVPGIYIGHISSLFGVNAFVLVCLNAATRGTILLSFARFMLCPYGVKIQVMVAARLPSLVCNFSSQGGMSRGLLRDFSSILTCCAAGYFPFDSGLMTRVIQVAWSGLSGFLDPLICFVLGSQDLWMSGVGLQGFSPGLSCFAAGYFPFEPRGLLAASLYFGWFKNIVGPCKVVAHNESCLKLLVVGSGRTQKNIVWGVLVDYWCLFLLGVLSSCMCLFWLGFLFAIFFGRMLKRWGVIPGAITWEMGLASLLFRSLGCFSGLSLACFFCHFQECMWMLCILVKGLVGLVCVYLLLHVAGGFLKDLFVSFLTF